MNDAWSIMDIVILVCGVYALYAAYVLKTKGKIIKTFLVFKETDVNYEPLLGYDGGVDRNPDLVWNSDQKCNEKIFLNVFLILTFF